MVPRTESQRVREVVDRLRADEQGELLNPKIFRAYDIRGDADRDLTDALAGALDGPMVRSFERTAAVASP